MVAFDGISTFSNQNTWLLCIYYDEGSSTNISNYKGTSGTTISFDDEYYIIEYGTSGKNVELKTISEYVKGKTINFEADILTNGNPVAIRIIGDGDILISSTTSGQNGKFIIENFEIPSNLSNVYFRISGGNSNTSIKFKNMKIYVI